MSTIQHPSVRHERALRAQTRLAKRIGVGLLGLVLVFPVIWVLFLAPTTGKYATSFGSAVHDPKDFLITLVNGVTDAGLYFVVASGFTLIFGLMRVVNMAHGAFFLLGGYIALKLQREMVGQGGAFGLTSSQVNLTHWIIPTIVATLLIGLLGLAMQQIFLRWNQGQDLRQALITIAIAIILADQMLAHFGGMPRTSPGRATSTRSRTSASRASSTRPARLFILGIAVAIGVLLWVWLKHTRAGMIIRAGVDDRAMVSALGINLQLTFGVAFFIGSALAGLGGRDRRLVREPRARG